jgi:hypothetical protein
MFLALILLLVTGGGMQSLAASGFWRGTFSNIWNFDDNWMPGGYPNASGEVAFFGSGYGPKDVVISSTQVTVGAVVLINDTAYTISGENGGSLILQSASYYPASIFASGQAAHTINVPILLESNLSLTNSAEGNLTLSGDISEPLGEAHALTIRGTSPVAFLGNNSYSGGSDIRGGTLLLGSNTSAGTGSISLSCSSNPCDTPDVPSSLGNLSGDTVLQNLLTINHSFVQFTGPGSMSFTSPDSVLQASAKVVITGTLNLAKLNDPTLSRSLRRSGPGTLNLNLTPAGTNVGSYIRSDPGSGQMNLYGSGTVGRIYYRDSSGGGMIGVGDQLDVATGELIRSTGVLTVTGVLQTGTDSPGQADRVLAFDLQGTQPGSGYDQIVIKELHRYYGVLSTARITDTVLSVAVNPGFNPPVGTSFTLIQRTGGDGTSDDIIQGTFRDLPEDSIILTGDLAFQIHYTPDTVTLTRCEYPILTVTGGSPQSTLIGTSFPERLEVTAQYPDATPVQGLPIYFSAPGSGPSAVFTDTMPVLTGPDGKASVVSTANMLAGSYEVTAGVNNPVVTPVTFELTNLPAAATRLEVSGFPSPISAGQTGVFTVTVLDQWSQLITDYTGTVTFSSSDPSALLPEDYSFTLTDAGQHAFTATFYTAGLDHFLRATDIVSDTLTGEQTGIVVLPSEPVKIDLVSGSPQTTQVGNSFADPLVVLVTDAYSNTVPNVAVTYTGPAVGAGAVYTGTNPVLTDLTGQASLVAGANTVSGTYQVTATVTTPGVAPVYFDLTNTPGSVVGLSVFGYPSPVNAGSDHPFTVSAVDQYGNVNPAYRGSTYSLSSDPQAILPQDYLFTAQDAGSHVFNAIFKTAGMQSITIVDNRGLTGTQSGIVVEALVPARLSVDLNTSQSTQATQVLTAFPKPLAVVLTDQYGNPQSGYEITFTIPTSGASAILVGTNPQETGSDGRVSLDAAANQVTGSYEVLVSTNAPGVAPVTFSLTNLPGPAAVVTYISGSSQATPTGKAFPLPLIVEVTDANGNVVPGALVLYSAPLSGPSCTLDSGGQAVTGADGRASLLATANLSIGSYTVEARLVGIPTPAVFMLTNQQVLFLPVISR